MCCYTVVLVQAFMERLGLWGDGAMFSSFDVFFDTVQKKGLGMLTIYYLLNDSLLLYWCILLQTI